MKWANYIASDLNALLISGRAGREIIFYFLGLVWYIHVYWLFDDSLYYRVRLQNQ